MEIIDKELLDVTTLKAQESPRLRMNYNFHESSDAKSQRLLNALELNTEIPIHRHQNTAETYILLRGSLEVKFYDNLFNLIDLAILNPAEGKYGVNIPAGQWHTLKILEPGTVIFEVKDGPYLPLEPENIAGL